MLKGEEDIPDPSQKFRKRPAFRKGKSVDLCDSDYDPDLLEEDDLDQQKQLVLEL